MKEAQFVSILAHPRVDFCASAASNQNKSLVLIYSLKGQNATSFAKDLALEFANWQVNSPENLHQKILDLLAFTRQAKLELAFALVYLQKSDVQKPNIILASFNGQIILQRKQHSKIMLESQGELKMLVGNWQKQDQIILSNQAAGFFNQLIFELLTKGVSQEKLIGEINLAQNQKENDESGIAFVSYQDKILATDKAERNNRLAWRALLKKNLFNFFKIIKFFKKIPFLVKKIYTWLKKQNRQKIILSLTILTIGLSLLGGINFYFEKQKQQSIAQVQKQITLIKQEMGDLDQLVLQQPLLAREKAQKSLVALQALQKEKNHSSSHRMIVSEIEALTAKIAQIAGENSLDRLSVAYNLNNFLGSKMIVFDKKIFILESNGQEILQINPDGNQEKIVLEKQKQIRDFTISENKLYVLSEGLQVLDLLQTERLFTQLKEAGDSDQGASNLNSFGPYLYLVNRNKRNIYRYYYRNEQLSEPIGWLIDKQGISFEQINDLSVDGDLWLTTKTGQVMKFSKGKKVDFQIRGLSDLPNSPLYINTTEQLDRLAVLEKQKQRLLILTKDGQLINEIKSNELAGVSSLAFDLSGQKVFALSGSVIYEINL